MDELGVFGFGIEEAEFGAHAGEVVVLEEIGEGGDGGVGEFEGAVFFGMENREQGFSEAGHVPLGDAGLVSESVALMAVDGAEGGFGVVVVHEGAGTVVDGFPGKGDIVGIQHAMNEADVHPTGDKGGLALDGGVEEGESGGVGIGEVGVVASKGVIGEGF